MAIKKNIIQKFAGKEIQFDSAYIKIHSLNGNTLSVQITVLILDCAGGNEISNSLYNFNPSVDLAWYRQAYEYLKTLPEFLNATDC
jgi:hypothetical protein